MRKMNANLMGPACMQLDIHQMNITKRLDNLVAGMSILATFCYLSGNNGVFRELGMDATPAGLLITKK